MTIEGYNGARLEWDEGFVPEKPGTVIVFPGGGYCWLSERESKPVTASFRRGGYRAVILYYDTDSEVLGLNPARQAAWAVGKVKELHPGEPVYLLGFSAGAHCAASIGVHWDGRAWMGGDFLAEVRQYLDVHRSGDTTVDFLHDPRLFRADRLILSYPVITGGEYAHRGSFERLLGPTPEERALRWFSLETQVTAETPPTFLWQTATDDSVPVQNSLLFAQSLMQAHVPVELHIYPKGAHGLSLATEEVEQLAKGRLRDDHVAGWFDVMLDWLSYPI